MVSRNGASGTRIDEPAALYTVKEVACPAHCLVGVQRHENDALGIIVAGQFLNQAKEHCNAGSVGIRSRVHIALQDTQVVIMRGYHYVFVSPAGLEAYYVAANLVPDKERSAISGREGFQAVLGEAAGNKLRSLPRTSGPGTASCAHFTAEKLHIPPKLTDALGRSFPAKEKCTRKG